MDGVYWIRLGRSLSLCFRRTGPGRSGRMIAGWSAASCMCWDRAAGGVPVEWLPAAYGPRTTIFNRFNRWSIQGVWRKIFEQLAASGGFPGELAIDSTHIKVHSSTRGSKKRGTRSKRSAARGAAARAHEQDTRAGRRSRPARRLDPERREELRPAVPSWPDLDGGAQTPPAEL